MTRKILTISVLFLLATFCCAQNSDTSLTTPFLIKQHGYHVEEHIVQTSDGYILTMHRIPYSPKLNNNATHRPVAFLMHGSICASSVWVLNGPQRSLAYILSDTGYDIWMGNARGNVYSRKHISLSPNSQDFWKFDFHEIGVYDTTAMIEYALNVTGENQVRYIGHSQGGTTFIVLSTMIPSFQKHIRSAHLLAPGVFQSNAKSLLHKVGGPLLGQSSSFIELFANTELLPNSRAFELLSAAACIDRAITQDMCSNILFLVFGGASPYLNKTQVPEIAAIIPAGSSFKQFIHYFQLYNSGKFLQYDYGALRNVVVYGSIQPPDYNLANLDVPIYLYHSENDDLVSVLDINRLVVALNETKTLKGVYRVPLPEWNHIDFLFGIDVENVVYSAVMDDISKS